MPNLVVISRLAIKRSYNAIETHAWHTCLVLGTQEVTINYSVSITLLAPMALTFTQDHFKAKQRAKEILLMM